MELIREKMNWMEMEIKTSWSFQERTEKNQVKKWEKKREMGKMKMKKE
jgi:hypothetical protein